jgi:anthranilate synthase component 1
VVLIRHAARKTSLIRFVYGGEHSETAYHDAVAAMQAGIAALERIGAERWPAPAAAVRVEPEVDLDDAAFGALVERLRAHIVAGDVFQIVPSRSFAAPCLDPLAAYARLRQSNPSPYMFFVRGQAGVLFGSSPESAITVRGTPRRVAVSPLAGTRPRGLDGAGAVDRDLDSRLEAELRLSHKEVAEHMMLVDLARNDVARVSLPGSRSVERLLDVVRYSHVMHLESLVSGELRPELDALHAYVATMNMGTLTGAPKLRAAELLRGYESGRRGPYGGAVGYVTADGELDTCIVIRSAVVKDGVARVRAGCGVVYDSDAAEEAAETRRKAAAVVAAIGGRR